MNNVISDFNEKKLQIELYLNFVWVVDNLREIKDLEGIPNKTIINHETGVVEHELNDIIITGNYRINSDLVKILKSNSLLLLYNLIEGTINSVLNEYFLAINSKNLKFKNFQPEIQKVWLKYKHKLFQTNETSGDNYILNTIQSIIEETFAIVPKDIKDESIGGIRTLSNYDAYIAQTKLNEISGNIDARKINLIAKLYGLPVIQNTCDKMRYIKDKRNSLAHGNETFTDVGREYTVEQIISMKNEVVSFLLSFLNSVKDFIDNERYVKTI